MTKNAGSFIQEPAGELLQSEIGGVGNLQHGKKTQHPQWTPLTYGSPLLWNPLTYGGKFELYGENERPKI